MKRIFAVAPGYPYDPNQLQNSIQVLEKMGYQMYLPKGTLKPSGFHSNTDQKRAEFLLEALLSDQFDIVWAIRGGYGSNRLLPMLAKYEKQLRQMKPKIFLGLSDVTSLHLFFNLRLGWKTWHSPVLEAVGREDFPKARLHDLNQILSTGHLKMSYPIKPLNKRARTLKSIRSAKLIGGNLTVFQSHLGTPLIKSLKHAVLFFEDVGERGYRIDRILWQLQESGLLKDVKGIIFGEFTGGLEPNGKSLISYALKRFADEVNLPVYSGVQSGHGRGYKSVPLGAEILIQEQKLVLNS
jgi:muramoyltetrapeptide carboxypeptidase